MGWLAFAWGLLGVVALLSQALVRLGLLAWEAIDGGLSTGQWVGLVAWVVVMAHSEGYRGFHRRFSPRVVARALHLRRNPTPIRVALAPLFCMSLFGASPRGMKVARLVVLGIVSLVLVVRMLEQPWRGIIDAGVVVGLGIGLLSLFGFVVSAAFGRPPGIDPDLAEG